METTQTTYRALNTRANTYVQTLPDNDPVAKANTLIDRAVALQDEGRIGEADELLAQADLLLA